MRNIILADNQYITRLGWMYFVRKIDVSAVFKEVSNKKELVNALVDEPDSLVVLDYTLFDIGSVSELQILQMRFEKADWILFSDELSSTFLRQLLQCTHSFSVLLKDSSREELLVAFSESLKGQRFICNQISNLLLENTNIVTKQEKPLLTVTEQEILKEIALGKTTKEIAAKRMLSIHTVITHRKNIFRKIEVNNVHEATKYALRAGIVDMMEYNI